MGLREDATDAWAFFCRIVKQMRILFDQGFTDDDRQTYKEIISSNIILSMRSLVMGLQEMAVQFSPENASTVELFTSNATLFEQVPSFFLFLFGFH